MTKSTTKTLNCGCIIKTTNFAKDKNDMIMTKEETINECKIHKQLKEKKKKEKEEFETFPNKESKEIYEMLSNSLDQYFSESNSIDTTNKKLKEISIELENKINHNS